ncbi:MAG TPA: HdeD family acid-resistance protein [Roseiarcus sp.]|nr:HdeD family acid-resistance protein [Roseiarcus sp.]
MTNLASTGFGTVPSLAPLHAKWGWIVALGIVYLIAGVIALGSVFAATVASVFVVGIMMMIAGVAEVINAFQIKTWGRFFFWLILGILYIVAGFVAWDNPLLTAVWLTLFLGAALVASGIMRIFLGFNMQHGSPWIWVVVSGLITLVLGLIILAHWPVSAVYTLGIFLGVDLVFAGASWIGLGMALRNARPT